MKNNAYAAIINASNHGIIVIDAKTLEMLYANPKAMEYVLTKEGKYIGEKCYQYMVGRSSLCTECTKKKMDKDSNASHSGTIELKGKSYSFQLQRVEWEGKPALASIISDVTETNREHNELVKSEELLRRAIDDANLMDIRMPIMDGLTVTKTIRGLNTEDAKTIPIIAMTANAFAEDEALAKKMGMTGYLAKPVNAQEVYNVLALQTAENAGKKA